MQTSGEGTDFGWWRGQFAPADLFYLRGKRADGARGKRVVGRGFTTLSTERNQRGKTVLSVQKRRA